MQTKQLNVMLGFAFDTLVERDGKLYFTGTALETGVWTGIKGGSLYWPIDAIHDGMDGFHNKPITCMHGTAVGSVLDIRKTEMGFKSSGVVTSQRVIQAIKEKKLRGLSVTTDVLIDPVRRTVIKLVNQRDIAIVDEPACRTCMLENTWDDNMAKAKAQVENAAAPVEAELSATPVVEEIVDAEETVELAADAPVVETEVEAVVETVEMADLITKVAEQELQLAELAAEVSVLRSENETYRGQARAEMEQAIMGLDPTVKAEHISEFSDVALAVYFNTVAKLTSRPKVVQTPKGVKVNAAPAPAVEATKAAATKKVNINKVMAEYLKGIPKEK